MVGAGLAGSTAAAVLGQQGRSVILIDPRPEYPPVFKAEKIEPEQAEMLRKLHLLEHLLPFAGRVREVRGAYNGRIFRVTPIEQYGINYSEMVNAIRTHLAAIVQFKQARVEHIENSDDVQRVRLAGGGALTSRLVVLACGVSGELQAGLGLRRHVIQKDQSVAFGFTVARSQAQPFDFDALTYYAGGSDAQIDYLSLFRFRDTMRANLFAFRRGADPWVRQFIKEPTPMLKRYLPKLRRVLGDFNVVSPVEFGHIDFYRMEGDPQPGVVLIGDAFQNVCPSTAMGLSKILTDVDVLCLECVPVWFATPGMERDKIVSFYNSPRKQATDARAIQSARYRRRASTDRSFRWRIHRIRLRLRMRFARTVSGGR